jgi:hypothetical protein
MRVGFDGVLPVSRKASSGGAGSKNSVETRYHARVQVVVKKSSLAIAER